MSGPKLLEYMGAHILYNSHIKDAENPCGLCLNSGSLCAFRLVKRNKIDRIDMMNSHCSNLYKVQLASAAKHSRSPCTNVPLRCPLCPKDSDCIWKYNMLAHILKYHPSANIDLYHHHFMLIEDKHVLMKAVYLAKPC